MLLSGTAIIQSIIHINFSFTLFISFINQTFFHIDNCSLVYHNI